ncbi:EsaB/YukD family protein [Dactylosporangium sp. CA-233914]|uniref:EsaB/YukD family protein n=1 Tax=Dactylosporangium sp. CA-233914 TaxID=3239934 RepID=UPI003D911FE6
MAEGQSRVTVVGAHKRVDVALPTSTPIGEYSARLAELCGQDRDPLKPPAWSLAPAGEVPFPLTAHLGELDVVDGQVLYLRDVAREPGDPPVVEDLDELVADETRASRRRMLPAGHVATYLGLLWMCATAVVLGRQPHASTGTVIALALAGLVLCATAWALSQRGGMIPIQLRRAMVLTALPCLAVAGEIVGLATGGPDYGWAGVIVGANVAGLIALAVLPDPYFFAIELHLVVAALMMTLIMSLHADRVETAALVAATSAGMLALARTIAAAFIASGHSALRSAPAAATGAGELVDRTRRLLAVVLAGPAIALTVTLPVLTASGNAFGLGLAGIVSAGLLVRARLAGFTVELLTFMGTGFVGLFSVLSDNGWVLHAAPSTRSIVLTIAALTVVGLGVALSLLGPADPDDATLASGMRKPVRRTRAEVVGAMTAMAVAPLTLGVFGMFSHLISVGRHLF